MNIVFQTMNTAYPKPAPTQQKRAHQALKAKGGDYDTVNIRSSRSVPDDKESFARMLARKAASQVGEGASTERVQELGRKIADGTYQPDAQKIAGCLLGLG